MAVGSFALDKDSRAEFLGVQSSSDDELLKAAKSCPYKAIVIVNTTTQEQIFPIRYRNRA